MSLSDATREEINRFAGEQARRYVDAAEATYLERLRGKAGQARQKLERKLARFKGDSRQARDAQDDMILYINDYMADLMAQGVGEEEALQKAKTEFASEEEHALRHGEKHAAQAEQEAIGLLYAGCLLLGLALGGVAGYIGGGGWRQFASGGWIHMVAGVCAGAVLGMGAAFVCHALLVRKR